MGDGEASGDERSLSLLFSTSLQRIVEKRRLCASYGISRYAHTYTHNDKITHERDVRVSLNLFSII